MTIFEPFLEIASVLLGIFLQNWRLKLALNTVFMIFEKVFAKNIFFLAKTNVKFADINTFSQFFCIF
jgi:hypothetical protein